ncbi:arginine--tRNA ligase [Roseivirga pacifica]|uniref:arginine--tRNA ligase n=1 Tax=Roseivirga pacifica TaxID=1267423 RepID=UPI0020963D05|nr:arginine--tRNA ligase [Roseivirga pacifica]MCO6357763.1 arginine--tRNA ligase [Roseivirga pacifica]MCO6366016.1 arginine--tRNA ligase [Roseivirga pacifica]MCO6371344.1 arginine--tRNA ligase [Roseivirga pacifica]MCO6375485.1 arginine--tRNA ligase [Roseivirga pacifica]MCO6378722.1 arginine--tRNA ligase [Roseivirga pacifica]
MELQIKEAISAALKALYDHTVSAEEIALQPTRKEFEGTYTFVTFPFARVSRKSPEQTATDIGEHIQANAAEVAAFNVVKGFLNISLSEASQVNQFAGIFNGADVSQSAIFQKPATGKTVVVEYSSPNTNKPLHLGHLRNNFLGNSVSRILAAAGNNVQKVQIINDRGIHICKSMLAWQKFGEGETPESSGLKGDHLVGKYYVAFDKAYKAEIAELVAGGMGKEQAEKEAPLLLEAQVMLKKWEAKDPEVYALWEKMNGWVYSGFNATYERMGVDFDKLYYESDTYLIGRDRVMEGLEKGVFYKKEDGSVWVDLTDEGLDEKLLLRSDGTSVYMTQDIGTALMRFDDYPDLSQLIYTVGNEQEYHFKVLFLILKKLGYAWADACYHLSYGMVDLPSGKMKSREGTVVDADDLMQEMADTAKARTEELGKIEGFTEEQAKELYEMLGLGAIKYFLLKVDPRKRMLFNPEESIEFQGNTGPFVQYTHARISAILRKAQQLGVSMEDINFDGIEEVHQNEKDLIYALSTYPEKLQLAADTYSPAIIAQYVYDLAKEYNRFYTELSIFNESDDTLQQFRVALSALTAQTIKVGMGLLGIQVPERM